MISRILVLLAGGWLLAACSSENTHIVSGYVEGDFVYVSAPEGGWVTDVLARRGDNVKAGAPLFSLDADAQTAQRDQAAAQLAQARAQLANVQKGRRPEEISALEAAVLQARSVSDLAASEFRRASDLKARGFVSQSFLDARRAQRDASQQQLKQAEATLALARKGARDDEIAAAKANVGAAQSALAKADYALRQRQILSRVTGRVQDVLRQKGEFVPPGGAIIQLLPPENVRIRFFVPEVLRARIRPGVKVEVNCDGCGKALSARVTFLSPTAEYTPPVIYSIGSREKLVWMVEAEPDRGVHLSPGQPVDVTLP